MWTCGPAYLACFEDALDDPNVDPFLVTQDHPPYEVRLTALVKGARDLGFSDYTKGLEMTAARWHRSSRTPQKDNRLLALVDPLILNGCVGAAFSFCDSYKLSRCTVDRSERLKQRADAVPIDEVGVDLLLMAWLVHREQGEAVYEAWEKEVLAQTAHTVKQLSQ